jgi:hypothetical protein
MTTLTDTLSSLRDQYKTRIFEQNNYEANNEMMINGTFLGAGSSVSIISTETMTHLAPACIAAPKVSLVAGNAIKFGDRGDKPYPVRIYAPKQLSIITQNLSIGDLSIVVEPEDASVYCNRLTFGPSSTEKLIEVVTSWTKDGVDIEMPPRNENEHKKTDTL